ncbi:MAG TPA: glycerophosphodiester phosphodiesterase family protein [Bacillota bacterium]|nr:glycerophosphodiester phosphodiesterase family protein [Bacillota bacterium]
MEIKALAHRGYPIKHAENTIQSYKAAYDLGFTHLELDVQLSKDGIPILMHDITVNRMTNSKGFVKDFSFQELRSLVVGENGTIPTLEEALLFAKDKMTVSIELKQMGNLYKGLEQAVLDIINKTEMMNQVYVNSFDHYAIAKMRELSDQIELGLIQHGSTPAIFPFMEDINATYLSVRVEYLTKEYVDTCHQKGIQVVVWPVDFKWQFDIVKKYPSVLSTTNKLEEFKSFYESHFSNEFNQRL